MEKFHLHFIFGKATYSESSVFEQRVGFNNVDGLGNELNHFVNESDASAPHTTKM